MFKALLLFIFAAICFWITENQPEKKTFPIDYTPSQQELSSPDFDLSKIKDKMNLLRNACSKVFWYSSIDVDSAKAFTSQAMPYQTEQKGGKNMIEVHVKLKNQLQMIPNGFNASGHTLFFHLGNGGIFTDKRLTQQLCGWEVSKDGSSMFKEVEGL